MSALPPFYSHLSVAAAALGFAHSYTLLALEAEPSGLLLEAAISDAKTALAYLMHASNALNETRQETARCHSASDELRISLKAG